jgi:hypothetical protein
MPVATAGTRRSGGRPDQDLPGSSAENAAREGQVARVTWWSRGTRSWTSIGMTSRERRSVFDSATPALVRGGGRRDPRRMEAPDQRAADERATDGHAKAASDESRAEQLPVSGQTEEDARDQRERTRELAAEVAVTENSLAATFSSMAESALRQGRVKDARRLEREAAAALRGAAGRRTRASPCRGEADGHFASRVGPGDDGEPPGCGPPRPGRGGPTAGRGSPVAGRRRPVPGRGPPAGRGSGGA